MSLYFWQHLGVLGWIGFLLAWTGFVLSWTRFFQASMACTAFGATALGLELIMDRIDFRHLLGSLILFLIAFVIIIVAALRERRELYGKREGVVSDDPPAA